MPNTSESCSLRRNRPIRLQARRSLVRSLAVGFRVVGLPHCMHADVGRITKAFSTSSLISTVCSPIIRWSLVRVQPATRKQTCRPCEGSGPLSHNWLRALCLTFRLGSGLLYTGRWESRLVERLESTGVRPLSVSKPLDRSRISVNAHCSLPSGTGSGVPSPIFQGWRKWRRSNLGGKQ
jgi:hypothetical protein